MRASVTEDDLHYSLAAWLRLQRINGLWWHTPNTSSSPQYARKLARMGRRPGVLDFEFLRKPRYPAFIELKVHPRDLSEDQEIFCAALRHMDVPYTVIRTKSPEATIEQANAFLREHGFIVR